MPWFSELSRERLSTCDPRLVAVCEEVVRVFDVKILEGARAPERQDELFEAGLTEKKAGQSKHQHVHPETGEPMSWAVDLIPYPFTPDDWEDTRRFYVMWGHVQAAGARLGVKLRWGGDWNGDGSFRDQKFNDLAHLELADVYEDPLGAQSSGAP